MKDATNIYKRNIHTVVNATSLIFSLWFNIDSLAIGKFLWTNQVQRAAINAIAENIAQSDQPPDKKIADINILKQSLAALGLPWGWEGSSLPLGLWPQKILGLLITTIAVSQGSSFWYDVLRKATQRPSISSPRTSSA